MKELPAAEASASQRVPVAADVTTEPEDELPAIDLQPLTDGIALLGRFDLILAELTSSLGRPVTPERMSTTKPFPLR